MAVDEVNLRVAAEEMWRRGIRCGQTASLESSCGTGRNWKRSTVVEQGSCGINSDQRRRGDDVVVCGRAASSERVTRCGEIDQRWQDEHGSEVHRHDWE
ncbi:hypothetical protein M0R45_026493 [Rubus argutus]|uniref:Uncharacterized protein n=1 Tax=Rubus argutus TaxID=59490 RepID=A0AAW1WZI2_RUBAR